MIWPRDMRMPSRRIRPKTDLVGKTRLITLGNPMHDQTRKPADLHRMQIIRAHEHFDAAQRSFAL